MNDIANRKTGNPDRWDEEQLAKKVGMAIKKDLVELGKKYRKMIEDSGEDYDITLAYTKFYVGRETLLKMDMGKAGYRKPLYRSK